ncbi:hypothetical protein [Phenylobacterium sp.]|uniref:hypothetical protein n=1 Tax=Phenylobacterium sp. TaxID=1871053 RepID=UPI002FCAA2D9
MAGFQPARDGDWEGQVHHRVDLRFRHLFPKADPNRLANLVALEAEAHNLATQATSAFIRGLGGRTPSQAEILAHIIKVDKLIEPYILRAGVPKPPPAPRLGGPR